MLYFGTDFTSGGTVTCNSSASSLFITYGSTSHGITFLKSIGVIPKSSKVGKFGSILSLA